MIAPYLHILGLSAFLSIFAHCDIVCTKYIYIHTLALNTHNPLHEKWPEKLLKLNPAYFALYFHKFVCNNIKNIKIATKKVNILKEDIQGG